MFARLAAPDGGVQRVGAGAPIAVVQCARPRAEVLGVAVRWRRGYGSLPLASTRGSAPRAPGRRASMVRAALGGF